MRNIAIIGNRNSKNSKFDFHTYYQIAKEFEKRDVATEFFCSASLDESKNFLLLSLQKGIREYVTIGGDGSLHFMLNILMSQDIIAFFELKLGLIPLGTGNDYLKNYDIKSKQDIIDRIILSHTKVVDIGEIFFGNNEKKYFVNLAGIGFNGAVIQKINQWKWMGSFSYYFALIQSFLGYQSAMLRVKIDKSIHEETTFLLSIGLGKYAGGGMKLCPEAIVDDGLFDINLIPKVGLWDLIRNIAALRDGSYLNNIDCLSMRGRKIEIIENTSLHMEADGEYYGRDVKSIEILEGKMMFFC